QACNEPLRDRIGDLHEYNRHRSGGFPDDLQIFRGGRQDHLRPETDQLGRISLPQRSTASVPANIDVEILALNPSKLPERLHECRQIRLSHRISRRIAHQHADPPRLLRSRRKRPRRRAAEQRDELAAFHSITSSASSTNESGIVSPIPLAALRLTINS